MADHDEGGAGGRLVEQQDVPDRSLWSSAGYREAALPLGHRQVRRCPRAGHVLRPTCRHVIQCL